MGLGRQKRRWLIALTITLTLASSVSAAVLAEDEPPTHRVNRATIAHSPVRPPRLRARRFIIGHSVDGRAIYAIHLGGRHPKRTLLVVGCIHGNESAGIAIARHLSTAPPRPVISLWIIPDLNPDGAAADRRQNARGVDLNRNFPWHWRPLGIFGDPQYSGPRPLSEPEARAAYRLIKRIRPTITIWFHQPEAVVDLSGGNAQIERAFAKLVDLPTRRLTRYPGSAINWENTYNPRSTAFDVELPRGTLSHSAIARYTDAVDTLWLRSTPWQGSAQRGA
jgi:murein peptide amidase A